MKNDSSFFQNTACEFFPCHKLKSEDFNCMFCYCPLYALGENCGGNFTFSEYGIKDCSNCTLPHSSKGYSHIMSKIADVIELVKTKE